MDHTITVTISDNGNVRLHRPSSIDDHAASAGLRQAADIIDRWTELHADHLEPDQQRDTCEQHPDTPLTIAGNCSLCGTPVRR